MSVKLDLLVFGAHPDDAEIGMGGTIVKHAVRGQLVGICDLTRAEMSSNGDVHTRAREAAAAAEVLGVAYRSNLQLPDRGLRQERAQVDLLTHEIRKLQPRVVFAPYWEDRHPDHVQCSRMVEEAVFNAKLRRYMPELPAWGVEQLVFYFINDLHKPDIVVDVSEEYARKVQSLQAYPSQFVMQSDSVETPLTQQYVQRVEARDRVLGQAHALGFAEGFICKQPWLIERF